MLGNSTAVADTIDRSRDRRHPPLAAAPAATAEAVPRGEGVPNLRARPGRHEEHQDRSNYCFAALHGSLAAQASARHVTGAAGSSRSHPPACRHLPGCAGCREFEHSAFPAEYARELLDVMHNDPAHNQTWAALWATQPGPDDVFTSEARACCRAGRFAGLA